MEPRKTETINSTSRFAELENTDSLGSLTKEKLDALLAANADFANNDSVYGSEKEKLEANSMKNPMSIEDAFSYFGLLLGLFPPAAFFLKMLFDIGEFKGESAWLLLLMLVVNIAAAAVGYFSGKVVGKIVFSLEKYSWWTMMFLMPFIGILWGMISGGTAGLFIFIFGAFFGAAIGGAVGGVALPLFASLHRIFKIGDKIERKLFLPIAFGISFIISGFILGM